MKNQFHELQAFPQQLKYLKILLILCQEKIKIKLTITFIVHYAKTCKRRVCNLHIQYCLDFSKIALNHSKIYNFHIIVR